MFKVNKKAKYTLRTRIKKSEKKLNIRFAGIAVAFLSAIFLPIFASAVSDTTAPTVSDGFVYSQQGFDISTDLYTLFLGIEVSDDISGMAGSTITYTSPSMAQFWSADFLPPAEGQILTTSDITFPQYSEHGQWLPRLILRDNSGNTRVMEHQDLLLNGIDLTINFTGIGDTTQPVLTNAFHLNPAVLDVTASEQYIASRFVSTDNLTGTGRGYLSYTSPSGDQTVASDFFGSTPNGESDTNTLFPRYAELGVWIPTFTLSDGVGNSVTFSDSQLQQMGYDLRVTLTGIGDTTTPTVSNLLVGLSHPQTEIELSTAIITLTGVFTDDLSGVYEPIITYRSASTNQSASGVFTPTNDGEYTTTFALPPYAEYGEWLPELMVRDSANNVQTYNNTQLLDLGFDLAISLIKSNTETALADIPVSSDEENDGATPTDPIEASVTTPDGGSVSVVLLDSSTIADGTSGFLFSGQQVNISAPQATPEDPLLLEFVLDASQIPEGQSYNDVQIARNGIAVQNCLSPTTTDPDPCVYERLLGPGGDALLRVRTSSASIWYIGFPAQAYNFEGFLNPVKDPPVMNKVEAGQTVPVKFSLGGNFGLDVLAAGYPKSQKIACSSLVEVRDEVTASSVNDKGLKFQNNHYRYNWKTKSAWDGTCRQFILQFADGTNRVAYFKFR